MAAREQIDKANAKARELLKAAGNGITEEEEKKREKNNDDRRKYY